MTLRKTMNYLLTALLIGTVSILGGFLVAQHYQQLGYAFLVSYRQQLPENANLADGLKARVKSFESALNTSLPMKNRMQRANAHIQMAMGKELLSYGGSSMVMTKQGYLYDLMEDTDATKKVRATTLHGLQALHDRLAAQGIPMLYGYAHTTLYDGVELPEGVTDDNNEVADEIIASLKSFGIEALDSRQIIRESGLPLGETIYRTDAHWSARAAFEMYKAMVDLLNEKTVVKADKAAADISNFNIAVLPHAHISDIGNRLGAETIEPDDFELITPKFDTTIHRDISKDKQMIASDGRFEDVVLDKSMLPAAQSRPYTNCFNYYGQHPDVVYYHNETAPEGRVLIVKDSFGTPTSSFMALAVRDVCAIDLRKTTKTVEDYVASFKPDVVIFVQCQEVMRGANFVFVDK